MKRTYPNLLSAAACALSFAFEDEPLADLENAEASSLQCLIHSFTFLRESGSSSGFSKTDL